MLKDEPAHSEFSEVEVISLGGNGACDSDQIDNDGVHGRDFGLVWVDALCPSQQFR